MSQADNKFTQDELLSLFSNMMGPAAAAPAAPPVSPPAPAPVVAPPPLVPAPAGAPPAAPPPPPPLAPPPPPPPVAAGMSAPVAPPPPPVISAPPPVMAAPSAPPSVLGRPPAAVAAPPVTSPPPAPAEAPAPVAALPTAVTVDPAARAAVEDLGHQFEIGRNRVEQVLTPFIGEKVTKKMLAWSLERAQKNHPIMRNVHWAPSGDLLDNGEIEVTALVKNLDTFPGQDVRALVKAALNELLTMRLAAVEQGLGPSMRQAVEKEVARLGELLR